MAMRPRCRPAWRPAPGRASRAFAAIGAGLAVALAAFPALAKLRVEQTADAVVVRDGATPVLTYRVRPGPAPAEPWRMHYIHPLHAPDGAVLTQDRPEDHLHQRGVFQAWRRILLDGRQVADSWVMKDIAYDLTRVTHRAGPAGSVEIVVDADWTVSGLGVLVREAAVIRIEPLAAGERRLTWDSRLTAQRDGVALAGTDDDKGYSGPSIRFVRNDVMRFTSGDRVLTPAVGAVETGDAVLFRWPSDPGLSAWEVEGRCAVDGRPIRRWILRRELSMQTCAFPGRAPVGLAKGKPLRVFTSLVVRPRGAAPK